MVDDFKEIVFSRHIRANALQSSQTVIACTRATEVKASPNTTVGEGKVDAKKLFDD